MFLAEAYNYAYEQVMNMPCSRRHKQVKFRQDVVRQRNMNNNSGGGGSPGMHQSWYQAYQASQQGG